MLVAAEEGVKQDEDKRFSLSKMFIIDHHPKTV